MAAMVSAGWGPPGQGVGLRVLLVEDDDPIAEQLARGLTRAGYSVERVASGLDAVLARPADIAIVDLGLPDIDGTEVCRRLRAASDLVLVVVTARGGEADRVHALDLGADDYLVKPFGFAELLARLRAALRRAHPDRPGPEASGEVLSSGPLTVDLRTRRVSVQGTDVALTAKEFGILACLLEDPGRVLTRQEILERVWDTHWYGPTRVLDVHVAALRRKLGVPGLVETVYGVGFRVPELP